MSRWRYNSAFVAQANSNALLYDGVHMIGHASDWRADLSTWRQVPVSSLFYSYPGPAYPYLGF